MLKLRVLDLFFSLKWMLLLLHSVKYRKRYRWVPVPNFRYWYRYRTGSNVNGTQPSTVCFFSVFHWWQASFSSLFLSLLFLLCGIAPKGETFTNLQFSFRAVWIVRKRRDEGRAQTPLMSAEWGQLLIDACDGRIISLKVITLSSMLHRYHLATAVEKNLCECRARWRKMTLEVLIGSRAVQLSTDTDYKKDE